MANNRNRNDRMNPYQSHDRGNFGNPRGNSNQISPRDYDDRDYGRDYSRDPRLSPQDLYTQQSRTQTQDQWSAQNDHDSTYKSGADYGNYGRGDWDQFSGRDERFSGGYNGRAGGFNRETSGPRQNSYPFANTREMVEQSGYTSDDLRSAGFNRTSYDSNAYPSNSYGHSYDNDPFAYGATGNERHQSGSYRGTPVPGIRSSSSYQSTGQNGGHYSNQYTNSSTGGHAGRGPKNWKRSDERIKDEVSEALERHTEIDASEIEVHVKDSVVILTGAVEHRLTKRMAEDVCAEVSGVRDVRNELTVNQSLFDQAREVLTGEPVRAEKPTNRTNPKH